MRLLTFVRFIRMITKEGPADIDKIQKMGLLAVKLTQIFALRPDLLSEEKCRQLQSLYQRANSIPKEDSMKLIRERAPSKFLDAFESFEEEPFAAASIGQVHRGVLKDGSEVVVKIIKADFEKSFRKDVARMRRWLRIGLFLNPRLRKVGNPVGLLQHVEDYTLRELDLRNEIQGSELLQSKAKEVEHQFPMPLLKFPKVWSELSNRHVLVMEHVKAPTLESRLSNKDLSWDDLLQLFRIHGAFMFGIGTFHGDLHPGNAMVDEDGMKTVQIAVLAGCRFGEEAFPIIRSLMYMDGMVLRGHPDVDLISSMGPYLDEFASIVELPYKSNSSNSKKSENAFWEGDLKPTN